MESTVTVQQQAMTPPSGQSQLVRYRHSCENCRRRKIKCSGTRPTCDHCLRRSIQCVYKPLARSSRRTSSMVSSPAMSMPIPSPYDFVLQHRAMQTPPVNASGHVQPIAIPLAASPPNQYKASLQMFQQKQNANNGRYASAPVTNTASPFMPSMYTQAKQPKQIRPANAIPPYLCNINPAGSTPSPLHSPQLSYMYGPPGGASDMMVDSSPGSYNSVQSDFSDLASQHGFMVISNGGTPVGNVTEDPMNFAAFSSSMYDIQHPTTPGQQQGPSGAPYSPGVSTVQPASLAAAAAAFNLPAQFSIPSSAQQPLGSNRPNAWSPASTTDPLLSLGNTSLTASPPDLGKHSAGTSTGTGPGHKRNNTADSPASISNAPLLSRVAMEGNSNNSNDPQMPMQPLAAPSNLDALFPPTIDGSHPLLACNNQAYIDMISCNLNGDPSAADGFPFFSDKFMDLSMPMSQQQQPQPPQQQPSGSNSFAEPAVPGQQQQQQQPQPQQQQPGGGIAPELTVYQAGRVPGRQPTATAIDHR
ncbi:hypothetical protein GQ54DRAFT_181772 [Martensiomyces pterosporus]|nr:hypothetical protein GQ54DRAFT_181772 [Martensiomyces pterosporus]